VAHIDRTILKLDTSNKITTYHIIILPTAYVLVLLDYNYPDYEIMSQLSKLACVTEVNRVDGPYDIIVKLSDNNMDTIKESIGRHMTRIQGIQSTLTLMSE
jgi:DNA-binding Lrp family transcriptional regulator